MSTTPLITTDPSRLAPDGSHVQSPISINGDGFAITSGSRYLAARQTRNQRRNRSRSKKRKGAWKKLLWVKQSYPDNYTDQETFLDHLQRNPRLQPYEFWPLVGESTIIVQQVCTMILFVCCFIGIIQERVSPVTIVSWASVGTVLGWVLWDAWVGQDELSKARIDGHPLGEDQKDTQTNGQGLGLSLPRSNASSRAANSSTDSSSSYTGTMSYDNSRRGSVIMETMSAQASHDDHDAIANTRGGATDSDMLGSRPSARTQQRITTLKSALLIYCALLGLSPILKSLTKSTASDSIWAISFWLMCINVIFFDYGGEVGATFPASLSTNAALMASTVLASRLPSTTHVFSLTLFSIEVFGLFPIFRRYLRHFSWRGHLLLTWALVMCASAGAYMVLSGGGWKAGVLGALLGCFLTSLAMGLCALWLISLQRHKNAIAGPWDAARPRLNARTY